jgi:aminopeptidase N
VTSAQIEAYISEHAGTDLTKVFDQYLRTTMVPVLEYRIEGSTLHYRWTNVVSGFAMPLRVTLEGSGFSVIRPTEAWKTARLKLGGRAFEVDPNYYVTAREALSH